MKFQVSFEFCTFNLKTDIYLCIFTTIHTLLSNDFLRIPVIYGNQRQTNQTFMVGHIDAHLLCRSTIKINILLHRELSTKNDNLL